jgi:hypothetical protein
VRLERRTDAASCPLGQVRKNRQVQEHQQRQSAEHTPHRVQCSDIVKLSLLCELFSG